MRGAEWYGETGASSIPRPLISLCKSWNSCSTGGWEHLHQEDCNSSRCWLIPTFSRRVRHGWWFKATWSKGHNRSIQIRAVSKEEILSIVKIDWWGLIPHLQLDSDTAPASLAVVCGVVGLLSVAGNVSLTDQASLSTNQCILHLEMKQNQLLLWYQICWNAEHFKWTSRATTHWNWTDSRGESLAEQSTSELREQGSMGNALYCARAERVWWVLSSSETIILTAYKWQAKLLLLNSLFPVLPGLVYLITAPSFCT